MHFCLYFCTEESEKKILKSGNFLKTVISGLHKTWVQATIPRICEKQRVASTTEISLCFIPAHTRSCKAEGRSEKSLRDCGIHPISIHHDATIWSINHSMQLNYRVGTFGRSWRVTRNVEMFAGKYKHKNIYTIHLCIYGTKVQNRKYKNKRICSKLVDRKHYTPAKI